MLLADGLDATIDDFAYDRQVAVADHAFDVKAGRIEAGTVSAQRFGRGWKVTVEGRPSMVLESRIATHGEDETDQGCLGTAIHAVHAIAPLCAATPGIRTFLDLPTIAGRGVLDA